MVVPPLIIAGMHRSGTSATARLMQSAGLDVGSQLVKPALDNPVGYFEDLEFLRLNVAMINAKVGDAPELQPSWAFVDHMRPGGFEPFRARGAELLERYGARGVPWGFKDPRTSVLLDFYDELAPDARYLLVYRSPWEVVDSLFRIQDRPLRGRADVAVQAWQAYNSALLDFHSRHGERCVLVHVDAVAQQPDEVVALVRDQLEAVAPGCLSPADGRSFERGLLKRAAPTSALAELLAADHPAAIELYGRLEGAADLSSIKPALKRALPEIHVYQGHQSVAVSAILATPDAAPVEEALMIGRADSGYLPAVVADAGLRWIPGDLFVISFGGVRRGPAFVGAVNALQADPELGAALLCADDGPMGLEPHDPVSSSADPGAMLVVRRTAWLAVRGFVSLAAPEGFDAWAFTVACQDAGIRTIRLTGAVEGRPTGLDAEAAWNTVVAGYPALAIERGHRLKAERDALADQLGAAQSVAEQREREQAALTAQLTELQATKAWRLAALWWRVRARLHAG